MVAGLHNLVVPAVQEEPRHNLAALADQVEVAFPSLRQGLEALQTAGWVGLVSLAVGDLVAEVLRTGG